MEASAMLLSLNDSNLVEQKEDAFDNPISKTEAKEDTLSKQNEPSKVDSILNSRRKGKKVFGGRKDTSLIDTSITEASQSVMVTPPDTGKWSKPKKAGLLSAIIPGAGQIYNRNVWKPFVVIGGFGTLVYFTDRSIKNKDYYYGMLEIYDQDIETDSAKTLIAAYVNNHERSEKLITVDGELFAAVVSEDQIQLDYEYYRDQVQNLYLGMVVLYGMNILDAVVEAHLKSFDVSDDLSLKLTPSIGNYSVLGSDHRPRINPGLSLRLRFR